MAYSIPDRAMRIRLLKRFTVKGAGEIRFMSAGVIIGPGSSASNACGKFASIAADLIPPRAPPEI